MSTHTNICDLYRSYCEEEFCRPNSAVMQSMVKHGEMFPVTMRLGSNYLGPRGLRPIIRLVAYCQTISELNLDGNGVNNEIVQQLCDVLETHLGMRTLSLRSNPITTSGGKCLLLLVERNSRLVDVDLTETDVFDALICKIRAVTERNRCKDVVETPQMFPVADEEEEQQQQQQMARSCIGSLGLRAPLRRPSLMVPPTLTKEKKTTTQTVAATGTGMPKALSGTLVPSNGRRTLLSQEQPAKGSKEVPTLTTLTSRQPPLAIASRDSSRLPEQQLRELQRRYMEKALLRHEINSSQVSKAADRAREELMLLEKNKGASFPRHLKGSTRKAPSVVLRGESEDGVETNVTQQGETEDGVDGDRNKEVKHGRSMPGSAADASSLLETPHKISLDGSNPPIDDEGDNRDAAAGGAIVDANSLIQEYLEDGGVASRSVATAMNSSSSGGEKDSSFTAALGMELESNEADTCCAETLPMGPEWMMLDSGEQIQRLFDCGCRAYVKHQFDTAYIAWNEAISIAVNQKNREWMAVLTTNLQRVSYEMLVREGIEHLNLDRLEEADLAFQRATEVAHKAHNAKWQSDMHKARKDVQQAVFHRYHEAAQKLFARARHMQDQTVTEDDYFVVPGTDVMVQHSQAYVNEWPRMLLVKEAVETWAVSRSVIQHIGGNVGQTLLDVVRVSLDEVTHFLIERNFDVEDVRSLSWMHTSKYEYQECVMLCTLWTDMASSSNFKEHHKHFAAIAAAQIGNYHLATNQLGHALTQFKALTMLAEELGDTLLRAAGHTFSALVNWQRGRYAVAESLLREAVVEWGALREEAHWQRKFQQSTTSNIEGMDCGSNGEGGSAASGIPRARSSKLLLYVPSDYVAVMETASFKYLVSSITSTYRYTEALEVLERSLVCKHRDLLFEKLQVNFAVQPTLDHIVAVSSQIRSCLLYQLVTHRYDWSTEERRYVVDEQLLMWVVPRGNEIRFVEVAVTKDFKLASIDKLIESVRRGLLLDPISSGGNGNNTEEVSDVITTLPKMNWVEPLQTLYAIIFDPVVEFMRAFDPLLMGTNGVITVIPTERLWLVPYNALVARNGKFVVENFALQLGFCATQCAFSVLSAERVQQRDLHRDVVLVQSEVETPAPYVHSHVAFPIDVLRSQNEGEFIMRALSQHKDSLQHPNNSRTGAVLRGAEICVNDLEALRGMLPKCRKVHIAASTTNATRNDESSAGAICVAVSRDEVSLLRASEIARMELFAELVVMTNANMSFSRVVGTNDDVQGLIRGFLSSGVPCIIVPQWCTPDMVPMDLFTKFYELLSSGNMLPQRSADTLEDPVYTSTRMMTGEEKEDGTSVEGKRARSLDGIENVEASETGHQQHHKALVLAWAIRELLEENFFRYSPRTWAGYYCVGYGAPSVPEGHGP